MNPSDQALSVFRQDYLGSRMNCAQAVCHGVQRDDLIVSMADCGGGRVEGGTCGALHAATVIAGAEGAALMRERFATLHGETTCRALKQGQRVSCQQCVGTAAQLLDEYLRESSECSSLS